MKWQKRVFNPKYTDDSEPRSLPDNGLEPRNLQLWRTPVPGGWLLVTSHADALTFIPDPQHRWDWWN